MKKKKQLAGPRITEHDGRKFSTALPHELPRPLDIRITEKNATWRIQVGPYSEPIEGGPLEVLDALALILVHAVDKNGCEYTHHTFWHDAEYKAAGDADSRKRQAAQAKAILRKIR